MKRSALALLLLGAALPALAGEENASPTVESLVEKASPPDFSHFPPTTSVIRVRHTLKEAGDVYDITWEFEKGKGDAPLVPRHADVDARRNGGKEVVFPVAPPGEGLLDSLKAYLEAFRRWDVEAMERYLPRADREGLEKDPAHGQDRLEAFEGVIGMDLSRWVEAALPRGGVAEAGVGSVELRYGYSGVSRGREGMFHVSVHWIVEEEGAARWIVKEIEPSFREAEPDRKGRDTVAQGGLREAIQRFGPPRIEGLVPDTIELGVKGRGRFDNRDFEIRANFEKASPGSGLFLEGFSLRLWGGPAKGRAVPETPPARGPFESVREALSALKSLDLEALHPYLPPEAREGFEEVGRKKLAEELKREEEKRGYSRIDVALKNLPGPFSDPRKWCVLELEWVVPGVRRAREGEGSRKGSFEIRIELFVPEPKAGNWIVDDLDVDFDRE